MKKNKLLLVLSFFGLIGFIIYRYGFLLILFLTSPKNGELSKEEIKLFNEIKKDINVNRIYRFPKNNISNPSDTLTYEIHIDGLKCKELNNLNLLANEIARKANNRLDLNEKFYKYDIYIFCEDLIKNYKFTFTRKKLNPNVKKI
ncbi:hypothetical protein EH230_13845 [Flavobacterium columnare]|uniref:Uncharacterized protein n=2 Tax=Flavobacterium TaxID=237 RepID=A0A246GH87_9FLAO|nr:MULTISPECIES: hypothetical protein [Flavobacterium]OWP83504.1 hypothetical protein BWK59_10135 [Flavobacterium davisii]RVU89841.1 hypothetical protein EH230_13845 [Flavobacterium columnare]